MTKQICGRCKQEKNISEFYSYKTKNRHWCKECDKSNTIIRQTIFKELCVEYKGGKCEKCGYDKYIGALQFHHKNPNEKDFTISHAKLKKFDDKIKAELDKCELLCANCHAEKHNTYNHKNLKLKWSLYDKQKQKIQERNIESKLTKTICTCGNKKSIKAKQCKKCINKKAIERNVDEVINKIKETNWVKAAEFFNITDNALRKFLKNRGIDYKKIQKGL